MSFKLFLVFLFSSSIVSGAIFVGTSRAALPWEDDRIHVDVYVVALTGVEVRGVDNVTKIIEGVQQAVNGVNERNFTFCSWTDIWHNVSSRYFFVTGEAYLGAVYIGARFPVNAIIHEVHEWSEYESVIEAHPECVVLNAHGSVIPVPSGYTKETWVDKIAEAMLYRNLTWVHVGGYPFFYYWHEQEDSVEAWGEKGFQQLMKHIEKPNITCPSTNYEIDTLSGQAHIYIGATWTTDDYERAKRDYPLKESDIKDHLALKIWSEQNYYTGAVVAFKKYQNQTSFGFYVHIGTNRTFHGEGWETDKDYWRAYVGVATGLWGLIGRTAGEHLISEAEAAIHKAEDEGRVQGLEEAYKKIEEAEGYYANYFYSIDLARLLYQGMIFAEEAEKPQPNFIEQNATALVVAVACVALGSTTALIWHKKRNNRKEETTK